MSLTYINFETHFTQFTVFTPGGQIATRRLLTELLEQWKVVFDGDPIIFPKFVDAPVDFPRIILKSANEQLQLEITAASVSVKWTVPAVASSPRIDEIMGLAIRVFQHYLDSAPAKAGRLALVIRRTAQEENPAKALVHHFCQERWFQAPFNRPQGLELHAYKQFQMSEFKVNSWVRCKTGVQTVPSGVGKLPGSQSFISVEHDINTLAEIAEETVFSPEEIQRFFTSALEEADKILHLYFPGD